MRFFGHGNSWITIAVHWGVVPVEEPLPLQSKLAVQDATDGATRRPMGSGKVLSTHPAVFGDDGGDGGD